MPELKMPFGPPPDGLQQRLPDWEIRLREVVNRNGRTPYKYGVFDCATFARMAVHAVTGVTLLPGVALPKGWLGAAKFLIKHDLEDVVELAIAALGVLPGDPDLARTGDLVVIDLADELHLGVRIGDSAVLPTVTGLSCVDRPCWVESFAIGWDPSVRLKIA